MLTKRRMITTGGLSVRITVTALLITMTALLSAPVTSYSQVSASGDLTARIDSIIALIPGETPANLYVGPNSSQQTLWRSIIQDMLNADYSSAHSSASSIDYEVVAFTDNTQSPSKTFYILERKPTATSYYWGTFIFNPDARRPKLVIQCPHPVQNINTGYQGLRVFETADAWIYFVAGTSKCNSTSYSPCDGTSTSCSETEEPYRDCDQAHIVTGTFQMTTEEILSVASDIIVIQPHGYSRYEDDPSIIMSNGTYFVPTEDPLPALRDNLLLIDNTLTFKLPHLESWAYYVGRDNAQGRLMNQAPDPCTDYATSSSGQFIHLEQRYTGLRDNATNWMKLANAVVLTFPALGQITSAQSGSWTSASTWVGGVVPTSEDDVLIAAEHVISIDDLSAECHSLTFGDTSAHIDMNQNSRLDIYGDFTLFNEFHNVFSAGWSSTNAKIRFAGYDAVQILSGWSTTGGSTSFRDMVIDKPNGKVVTGGNGMRLGIQNSLEIINGTLELAADDDLEARWASSGNFTENQTLTITIRANGKFILVDGDGSHFIRSGVDMPIGKMTIYGTATFTDASSYDINIDDIDVKNGGVLNLDTGLGSATYGPEFNPGIITVESGGEIMNTTITDIWFDTSVVILNQGATYKTTSVTTVFPPTFTNNGKVRYQRDFATLTDNQVIGDMDYYDVEFSFLSNNTQKIWTLTGDRAVTDSLIINNDVNFVLTADAPHSVTVGNTLRLSSGSLNNSDPDVSLEVSDNALISRATGTISSAPDFLGMVNLRYTSTSTSVATGPEFPTNPSVLKDITVICGTQTVTLSNDATVNGTVTLSNGIFDIDGPEGDYTLYLVDGATIRRATGEFSTAPTFGSYVDLNYISTVSGVTTGYEMPTGAGTLRNLTISGSKGVTLGSNITVNGTLDVQASMLTTGSYTVNLASGATLAETSPYTVYGNITTTRTVSQGVNNAFGNIGVEINAAGDDPGSTTVLRVTGTAPALPGVQGINRYFNITPATNDALNATLVFHYDESELNGVPEANLTLYYSDDGGTNWTPRGGVVNETANTVTLAGVNEFSLWTLGGMAQGVILSAQSGSWTSSSTWQGGTVPTSTDDVMILAGHTVSVDNNMAECHSISFGGENAHIDMNANSRLDVYGDFTLFSENHNVFSAGWSSENAYIRFTGGELQTLAGWSTTAGSTSFRDMIIEKDSATVIQTEGKGDPGMRFGLQNSLQVISGILIFNEGDDIEARWTSSGERTENQDLTINVSAGAEIRFVDGAGTHFIRSGIGIPIGKMTVAGWVELYDASSYDYNICNIDILDGGTFKIGTGLGSTTYGPEFNPGIITIDSGGSLYSITTTNVWFDTTEVDLKPGGTYKIASSSTFFPPTLYNNGKVRYQWDPATSTLDQTVVDTNYYRVEFSFNGNATKKIWTLNDNRTVIDSFIVNNDCELVLQAGSPLSVTVDGLLRMVSGNIDNSDADATLVVADDVWISRAYGTISSAPTFAGVANVRYTSNTVSVTTGPELPTAANVLKDLVIYATDQTVTLGENATVNGNLTLSAGIFDNNGAADNKILTMANGAKIRRATAELTAAPVFAGIVDVEYISEVGAVTTGPELPANTSVLRDLIISGNQGVNLGANVTVNGTLGIYDSILNTGSWTVTLAPTADIIENAGFVAQGNIMTTRTVAQGVNQTFGGLGLEINAAGAAPGATTVLRVTGIAPSISGGSGILRYFNVTPAVNSGLNATLVFHYDDGELNGVSESGLQLYSSTDGGSTWTARGGTVDAIANTVTLTGVSSLSLWALGSEAGYVCGDASGDGTVNLLDILYLIAYRYNTPAGPAPVPMEAGDANADGSINLLDILYLIAYRYNTPPGPAPLCP